MLKIESDNLYFRMIQESDMSIIAPAMTGVFATGKLPNETDKKYFYYKANKQNSAFPTTQRVLAENDKGTLNLTICLKSDDSPIGYYILQYIGTRVENPITALIPEQRGQGFYSEIIITKMRFNFDTLGASEVMGILPLSTSWLGNAAVKHTVDSLYTHDEKTFTIDQGDYRQTIATKTDWDAWIAASAKNSLSYNLTWN